MTKNVSWVFGLVFGTIISFCTALLFMLLGQMWAGGVTSFWGESWLYFSVIIPFAVNFSLLGIYFYNRKEITNKKLWILSLMSALFVTLYSGTIGAIFGETVVRGGMETINIDGTLIWGTIYAFVLLPLTTPYARLVNGLFYKLIKRLTP